MNWRTHHAEKRDFHRMQVSTTATLEASGTVLQATCCDLSGTGARLMSDTNPELDAGATCKVVISSGTEASEPLEAKARVVRVEENDQGKYEIALKLAEVK